MKGSGTIILVLSFFLAQAQIGNTLNFNKAKRLMSLDAFEEALPILDTLKHHYPKNYNLDFLIGKCLSNKMHNKEAAIPFLETASQNISKEYKNSFKTKKAPEQTYLLLAKAYLLNYQLDEALKITDEAIAKTHNKQLEESLKRLKENAQNAQRLMRKPIKIKIERLTKSVNSEFDDYTALVNADETIMVFTSRREGSTGGLKNDEGKYYEDIYISRKEDNKWTIAENIGDKINTERHDACVALSPDGSTLILYRDDFGIGNLYISYKDTAGWSVAKKLSQNINSKYNETHASFSNDGQRLYFVSDIIDGEGGKDIYFSNKLPNGQWAYPQNLGKHINTKYDEDGIFINPDGQKLYFSSKGHQSMGGYDIFSCDLIGDSIWSEPNNIGYPINTTGDDMFAVFSTDDKRAYYSANKKEEKAGFDIYKMDLMSLPERSNTVLKGYFKDANGKIIVGETLKVSTQNGLLIGKFKPNKEGLYTLVLKQGQKYELKISSHLLKNKILEVPEETSFFITQKALFIETIAQEK